MYDSVRSVVIRSRALSNRRPLRFEAIVAEMLRATTSERQGRLIDQDEGASMDKKKREGYF